MLNENDLVLEIPKIKRYLRQKCSQKWKLTGKDVDTLTKEAFCAFSTRNGLVARLKAVFPHNGPPNLDWEASLHIKRNGFPEIPISYKIAQKDWETALDKAFTQSVNLLEQDINRNMKVFETLIGI